MTRPLLLVLLVLTSPVWMLGALAWLCLQEPDDLTWVSKDA